MRPEPLHLAFDISLPWPALAGLVAVVVGAGYLILRLSERPKPGPRFDERD